VEERGRRLNDEDIPGINGGVVSKTTSTERKITSRRGRVERWVREVVRERRPRKEELQNDAGYNLEEEYHLAGKVHLTRRI